MIILEGADDTGKTVLAELLVKSNGYTICKATTPAGPIPDLDLYEWSMQWLKIAQRGNCKLVFDRFPQYSEQVYGPICRGFNRFTEEQQQTMHIGLMRATPLIIFCSNFNTNMEQSNGKEQMIGVREHYPEIVEAYKKLFAPYQLTHGWFCNYNYKDLKSVYHTFNTIGVYQTALQIQGGSAFELFRAFKKQWGKIE